MTTSYRNLIECQTEQQRIRALLEACEARLAAVEAERNRAMAGIENMERIRVGLTAERDAAQAGQARAVEFASTTKSTIEESLEWAKQDPEVAIELLKDLMNQADGIGYAHELGNALDWLAQQRAEAAAVELEMLRDHIQEYVGPDDARDEIRRICANRIKDLRAGKGEVK